MSCEEYLANLSRSRGNESETSREVDIAATISYVFTSIGLPIVCSFGMAGNILNLAVLTRKQLQRSMDTMEKSAHLGLVALAISDLLFCIFAFPIGFIPEKKYMYTSSESKLPLLFDVYIKTPVVNICIVSSTWLTVVMASARYLAICRPLHARGFINMSGTRITIACVFVGAILINLPMFWFYKVMEWKCADDCICYMPQTGTLLDRKTFVNAYQIVSAILAYFLPMVVLPFCNYCLIRALRQSSKMQRRYRVNRPRDSGHRITPTLIIIVILFFVLVVPAETLKLVQTNFKISTQASKAATHVTNFLQACNFAINFVLYCALNVHFRNTVRFIFCCEWITKRLKHGITQGPNHTVTLMTDIDTDMQTV